MSVFSWNLLKLATNYIYTKRIEHVTDFCNVVNHSHTDSVSFHKSSDYSYEITSDPDSANHSE